MDENTNEQRKSTRSASEKPIGPGESPLNMPNNELENASSGEQPTETTDAVGVDDTETAPSSKRGIVIALIALVVVIAIGFVAYDTLSRQSQSSASSTSTTGAGASAENASAGSSQDSTSQQGSDEDLPLLKDYDATVYTQEGDARTLSYIADGKPLVMNFWATWCPYCVQEMGDFQEIFNEYGDRVSFAFIDVADGSRETVEAASAWLLENGYTLPAYYDTTLEAMYMYGATGLPTTVVVGADGKIYDITSGRIDPDLMKNALDTLLKG